MSRYDVNGVNDYKTNTTDQCCTNNSLEIGNSVEVTLDTIETKINSLCNLFEDKLSTLYLINSVFEGPRPINTPKGCDPCKAADGYLNRVSSRLDDLDEIQRMIYNELIKQKKWVNL